MADTTLTDKQVTDLVDILRSDQSLDAKVHAVTAVKSGIKQHNVPDSCVPALFEALRVASTSQHASLVHAGFTALNHLLTRMSRQEPKFMVKEAARTLPVVVEKFGDQKDKFRLLAVQSVNTYYPVAPADVEKVVRTSAMTGKNPRAKETAMQWLVQAHQEQGLQFRSYVPLLMELLEDADGMVRDAAKITVIELFKDAPNTAKSDLKRQLKTFKVRPAIEQAIVKALAPNSTRPETPSEPLTSTSRPTTALAASMSSLAAERPVTPAAAEPREHIEPQYVNTNRELDDLMKDMAWHFEGKESEQNWFKREQNLGTLRKLIAGNAPDEFPETLLNGLRSLLDGIIKGASSLRTSLSKEACGLIQEMAITFGPALDPMVELLMQTLVKLCAGTKKISSQLADQSVDIIISRVTYTPRVMQHITGAAQDKNVQPRTYATEWMKTIIKKEAHHKSHVEHTGGVDAIDKAIRKGLGDANPSVREKMRSTFWAFHAVWPAKANSLMEDLDATAQKLLNKDPNNPNSPKKTDVARPGLGLSRSTMTATKPSLRETMMAQKKATLAAKNNLPARPGSAMANIVPVRHTTSSTSTTQANASSKPSVTRTRQEGTISVNAGGMSVAPMRPARRRPEIAPRPATAGPYSSRDHPSALSNTSPEGLKAKNFTPRAKDASPRRTAQRPRPGHAPHASDSNIVSPKPRPASKVGVSPRDSPAKLIQTQSSFAASSPLSANEDLTLVVPSTSDFKSPQTHAPAQTLPEPSAEEQAESSPESSSVSQAGSESEPETVQETQLSEQPTLVDEPVSPNVEPEQLVSSTPLHPPATEGLRSPHPPSEPLKVFEDPFVDNDITSKPTFSPPVLEEKPINEDAAKLQKGDELSQDVSDSPDKKGQNARLLDSGIARIKTKSLEVHGFRKLQSLVRDNKTVFSDDKFEAMLIGLFQYLEDPLPNIAFDKAQDVKAQILSTIKLLLKKERDNFQPHISKGLESLLETRSAYDSRAHIVSGLELLADELATIGDGSEIIVVLTKRLQSCTDASPPGCRTLGMGLHVLKAMLDRRAEFRPSQGELAKLTSLAGQCLESADSGVRMDAVQLCVALHSRAGEPMFWDAMKDVKDDPKSLITYYIVKRQREQGTAVA